MGLFKFIKDAGAKLFGGGSAQAATPAPQADALTQAVQGHGFDASKLQVQVEGDRVRVSGSVDGVRDGTAVRVLFSRPSAKHRLQAWVELLALSAAHPEREWRTVVIGRKGQLELGPVTPEFARLVLADLVLQLNARPHSA